MTPPAQTRTAPLADRLSAGLGAALLGLILAWTTGLSAHVAPGLRAEAVVALALGLAVALAIGADGGGRAAPMRRVAAVLALCALATLGVVLPDWQARLVRPDAGVVALGLAVLAAVLAASLRWLGWVLPGLLVALAAVCLWIGPDLPERFATRQVSPARLVAYLTLDTNGLLSRMTHIATATIAPFVLFGSVFAATGAGAALTHPLHHLLRTCHGGAAKAAVLGSAGFGMISGSAVANVATSGPVTIPLMRADAMPAEEAAAVEAAASSYGQIMPPVMGASAFLMAEWLGLAYAEIALAALVPAALGYLWLILMIDFGARAAARTPARRAPERARPRLARILPALVPFAILVHALFVAGAAPGRAALLGCAGVLAVQLAGAPRSGLAAALAPVLRGAMAAVPGIVGVLLLGASAALLMGLLNVSGAGFMLTVRLIDLAQGSFAALAGITAGLMILLGFGMPTVGVYLVGAGLCAPALVAAGADPLAAHLFILMIGVLSMVTPPVALASYTAAAIAGARSGATARAAFALGAGLAIVAVCLLMAPALLRPVSDPGFAAALAAATLAILSAAAAARGHAGRPLGPGARALGLGLAAALLAGLGTGSAATVWSAGAGAVMLLLAHSAAGQRVRRLLAGSPRETF